MIRAFLALLLLCAGPALAQDTVPAPAAPPAALAPGEVAVTLATSAGSIVLALDKAHAPLTTANFLRYVDARRFDGIGFYRAMSLGQGSGLIQGGLRNDPRRLFPPVPHEPTSRTGLIHRDGIISMARDRPGTATADFFITVGPLPSLDAHPGDEGFAAFGRVLSGMDVVRRILAMPVSATQGPAVMRGQMLAPPVRILTARRGGA